MIIPCYNVEGVRRIQETILLDEFSDVQSNETAYENTISGIDVLQSIFQLLSVEGLHQVLDVGIGSGGMIEILPQITHGVEPNPTRLAECKRKYSDRILACAWAENIPFPSNFDMVICWGTYCFLRSPMEALVEFNRVLKSNGHLVFDVVLHSTMPLAQTVEKLSFRGWLSLFGFEIIFEKEFGDTYHQRCAFVVRKYEEFNPRRFLMPQSMGKINNFLEERDWFLR